MSRRYIELMDRTGPAVGGEEFSYVGEELDLFSHAVRWKRYWSRKIAPYIGTDVLEVGAGTGTNTALLASARQRRWIAVEPDGALADRIRQRVSASDNRPGQLEIVTGDLTSVRATGIDTILYIDVLEHIEHDAEEMQRAFELLAPGGHLIILSPAHQALYSPFDQSIGHYRRYTRRTLTEAGRSCGKPHRMFYLDACGMLASLGNRFFSRQSLPTLQQIRFWDTYLVSASELIDPLLAFRLGKTVIGIWKR